MCWLLLLESGQVMDSRFLQNAEMYHLSFKVNYFHDCAVDILEYQLCSFT